MDNNATPNPSAGAEQSSGRVWWVRVVLWLPGLVVAVCAAAATAHGLYEVARASGMPPGIAALYPVITDGLAIVAYTATARLASGGRGYAWTVVVLAAGLSGVAQAGYLADGSVAAPAVLRVVIGAWPAIAAAIVAHLLFLLGHATRTHTGVSAPAATPEPLRPDAEPAVEPVDDGGDVQAFSVQPEPVQPPVEHPGVERLNTTGVDEPEPVAGGVCSVEETAPVPRVVEQSSETGARVAGSPARDTATEAARRYRHEHGELPTVTALVELAGVSRGTAAEALKPLRAESKSLHLVTSTIREPETKAQP